MTDQVVIVSKWPTLIEAGALNGSTLSRSLCTTPPAEVAWVLARRYQGHGYATEAARSLVLALQQAGWAVIAHIHPRHLASQGVARAAGLSPSSEIHDGETRWISNP